MPSLASTLGRRCPGSFRASRQLHGNRARPWLDLAGEELLRRRSPHPQTGLRLTDASSLPAVTVLCI